MGLLTMFFKFKRYLQRKKDPYFTKPFSAKIAKRVSKIPTADLEMWADQSLYELGRCLSSYLKTREEVYLTEARQGVEALHAVVEEVYKRRTLL